MDHRIDFTAHDFSRGLWVEHEIETDLSVSKIILLITVILSIIFHVQAMGFCIFIASAWRNTHRLMPFSTLSKPYNITYVYTSYTKKDCV